MKNLYLFAIYNGINAKNHFISDIVEAKNENKAIKKLLNKVYFCDSEQKRILGKCKKAILIHQIK